MRTGRYKITLHVYLKGFCKFKCWCFVGCVHIYSVKVYICCWYCHGLQLKYDILRWIYGGHLT